VSSTWNLLSRHGENAALGERLVEHRALDLAPLGDVVSAYGDYVGGDAQTAQLAAKPDRLRATVIDLGLDHEEVKVAAGVGIAAGMRSEQDDLR
jgi:GTP cyclohydrolase III